MCLVNLNCQSGIESVLQNLDIQWKLFSSVAVQKVINSETAILRRFCAYLRRKGQVNGKAELN